MSLSFSVVLTRLLLFAKLCYAYHSTCSCRPLMHVLAIALTVHVVIEEERLVSLWLVSYEISSHIGTCKVM